jgi:Site-specific recombinases, DNA invertase Pin homologs
MSKTAIYSRVSSVGQNHESQEREVMAFATRAGWYNVEVYRDTISGKKDVREGLTLLLEDCKAGKIERILAYKMDRLGRSTQHFLRLMDQFTTLHIPVIFTSQGISTEKSNPVTQFFMVILAGFAEMETAQRSERQMAGIANRRAKGLPMGKPGFPQEVQDKIVELNLKGLSQRDIALELKVSQSYVNKKLKNK